MKGNITKTERFYIVWGVRADGTEFNYRYQTKAEAKKACKEMGIEIV